MCNLYDIGPSSDRNRVGWQRAIREAIEDAPKQFGIRKTDPGVVARLNENSGEIEPEIMRWGFHRPFNPAVNNARTDKLDGGMWSKAWREKRRCLIPVRTFYEWSGPAGSKQTHAFQSADGEPVWMAGLWEPNSEEEIGLSYTMLTTAASKQVERIHHRMPAVLDPAHIEEFLNAEDPVGLLEPSDHELQIFECENPLKMKAEQHNGPIRIAFLPGFD